MQITTIGLDIAKNVFQVHGIDATAPFDAFLEPGRRMRFNRLERREFITLLGGATVGLLGAFALPPGEVIERAVFSCSVEHPRRD
jgi:hypothetical protein